MKKLLFEGKNFRLMRQRFTSATAGVEKTIEYLEQPEVVIAVPELPNGELILVEHIRPILATTLLECPGGKVDPGEDLEGCIIRELQEEIGYTSAKVDYLSYFYTSVGSSTEKIHAFIARELIPHARKAEDVKRMKVKILPPELVWNLLRNNELHDGKTEIALHKFFLRSQGTV